MFMLFLLPGTVFVKRQNGLSLHTDLRQNEYVNKLQPQVAHSNYYQLCMQFFQAICSENKY